MDIGDERYRDCMRDVLAMLEQCLELQVSGPDSQMVSENLALLLENADTQSCLKVSLSMLATSWQLLVHVRANARGTAAEQELADMLAAFRQHFS
jgi:hypothetical protein